MRKTNALHLKRQRLIADRDTCKETHTKKRHTHRGTCKELHQRCTPPFATHKRCYSKAWAIRKLKKLGASTEDLLIFQANKKHPRICLPSLESLTGDDRISLERVQKTVLHIILGDK